MPTFQQAALFKYTFCSCMHSVGVLPQKGCHNLILAMRDRSYSVTSCAILFILATTLSKPISAKERKKMERKFQPVETWLGLQGGDNMLICSPNYHELILIQNLYMCISAAIANIRFARLCSSQPQWP